LLLSCLAFLRLNVHPALCNRLLNCLRVQFQDAGMFEMSYEYLSKSPAQKRERLRKPRKVFSATASGCRPSVLSKFFSGDDFA
jgi:hypothetical protein